MSDNSFPHDSFSAEIAANDEYIKTFKYSGLTGVAKKAQQLLPAWIHELILCQ